MRIMWLCNTVPAVIADHAGISGSAFWMDSVLTQLAERPGMTLNVFCCSGGTDAAGEIGTQLEYHIFQCAKAPEIFRASQVDFFKKEVEKFQPDLIHIWGTEYAHTLEMMTALGELGMQDRAVISIQGLCSVIARHYMEGIPAHVCAGGTFRDWMRMDRITDQKRKFEKRGALEQEALRLADHVIGRTTWDAACTEAIHPGRQYHFCNETLRQPFYTGQWRYADCRKHRIFASSCIYPVKGFHNLLEAFAQVVRRYPDATLAVPGDSFLSLSLKGRLRESGYHRYMAKMARELGIADRIEFLGALSAEEMKENYLKSNVFVLPSTVENSPNSLGEAMLLGLPCVASDVGGVSDMMTHGVEGYIYQSTAPYMLAHYICQVFAMEDRAEAMGSAARSRGLRTHDGQKNLERLMEIYASIAG